MIRRLAPLALLLLCAACHRGNVADVTLDADASAENNTAVKTLSDLAAAEKAAAVPLPTAAAPVPATPREAAASPSGNNAENVSSPASSNASDVPPE